MKFIAPVDIKAGQEIELELVSVDGKPIIVPDDPGQSVLWHYEPGMVDVDDYNRWAFKELENKPTKPRTYTAGSGLQLYVETPHMPPLLMDDGRFLFDVRRDSYDHHCDLRPGDITEIGKTYHHSLTLKFSDASRRWLESTGWAAVIQHWQRARNNPPFALMVKQGQWAVQQYGAPDGPPANNSSWPIDAGARGLGVVGTDEHRIEIEYRPHPTDGMSRVVIDGKEIYRWEGSTCIAMPSGIGTRLYAGLYTDKDTIDAGDLAQVYIERLTYSASNESPVITPDDPAGEIEKLGIIVEPLTSHGELRVGITTSAVVRGADFETFFVNWQSGKSSLVFEDVSSRRTVGEDVSGASIELDSDGYYGVISRHGSPFQYQWVSGGSPYTLEIDGTIKPIEGDVCTVIDRGRAILKNHTSEARTWWLVYSNTPDRIQLHFDVRENESVYGMCAPFDLAGRKAMLVSVLRIDEVTEAGSQIGPIDVYLFTSDDLLTWERASMEPVIPRGSTYDSGMITTATNLIERTIHGQRVFVVHYGASNYLHSRFWAEQGSGAETVIAAAHVPESVLLSLL